MIGYSDGGFTDISPNPAILFHYESHLNPTIRRTTHPNQDKFQPYRLGIAKSIQGLAHELDDRGSIPSRGSEGNFSLHHLVQTGSGAQPASYPMGTGVLSPA